jgi:hypothetical protein
MKLRPIRGCRESGFFFPPCGTRRYTSTVRAARPATGAAFSRGQIFTAPLNPVAARFRFFGGSHPADILIARQGRDVLPGGQRFRMGSQGFFQIGGKSVHRAAGDFFLRHIITVSNPPIKKQIFRQDGFLKPCEP